MHLLKKLTYPFYKKLFLSLMITGSTAILLISLLLYYLFSSSTVKKLSDNSIAALRQMSNSVDTLYNDFIPVSLNLLNDNDMISCIFSYQLDYLREFRAVGLMNDIASVYPFIKYIGVYNSNLHRYIGTRGVTNDIGSSMTKKLNDYDGKGGMDFLLRSISSSFALTDNESPKSDVITFLIPTRVGAAQKIAIIIDYDAAYLKDNIESLIAQDSSSLNVLILDRENRIICDTGSSRFNVNADDAVISDIADTGTDAGYFVRRNEGTRYLVSFVVSEQLGWKYISIQEYGSVINDIIRLRNITVLITIALMLLSISFSFIMSGSLYLPVEKALETIFQYDSKHTVNEVKKENEISMIEKELISVFRLNRELEDREQLSETVLNLQFLQKLLRSYVDISPSDQTRAKAMGLTGPDFITVCIHLDDRRPLRKCSDIEENSTYWAGLWVLITELAIGRLTLHLALMEQNELAFVAMGTSTQIDNELVAILTQARESNRRNSKTSFSVGIGDCVKDLRDLHDSYVHASESIKYRMLLGDGSIIEYKDVIGRTSLVSSYPIQLERTLMEQINLGNKNKVSLLLNDFMGEIGYCSYYNAFSYMNQLLLAIYKGVEHLHNSRIYNRVHCILELMFDNHPISEISESINQLCSEIIDENITYNGNRINKSISFTKDYMQDHYADPNISVELVADILKLSPMYLGRMFKISTGLTFGAFLNAIRMDAARRQLSESNRTFADISESVGILNTTYFYTLFKKTYGVTPAQYRRKSMKA